MTHYQTVRLPAGEVQYTDTGGTGRPVVLLHGALMDDRLWDSVTAHLPAHLRLVAPVLPFGAHRLPLGPAADVSPAGVAAMVGDLISALQLDQAVLVGNDTGGAVAQLLVTADPHRVAGLMLVSCDAFDNFPPGLPGRVMAAAAAVPGGLRLAVASLGWRPLRRLPLTFGWMAKRPIPDHLVNHWVAAHAADPEVRRDLRRMLRQVDRHQLVAAAAELYRFTGPAMVVWAAEDRVMPPAHASRLAAALPQATVELVPDSYTLMPLDQPVVLASLITRLAADVAARPHPSAGGKPAAEPQ